MSQSRSDIQLSTIQDDPSSTGEDLTFQRIDHDIHSPISYGSVMGARAAPAVSSASCPLANKRSAPPVAGNATTRWRNRAVALLPIKILHVETLKALFRKLGYDEHIANLMTSTLWKSAIILYGNWDHTSFSHLWFYRADTISKLIRITWLIASVLVVDVSRQSEKLYTPKN